MRNYIIILTTIFLLIGCAKVPITGRRQMKILPSSQMNAMGIQSYSDFLKTNQLSTDEEQTALVKKVGNKLQKAVETYFSGDKNAKFIEGFNWEYNLVESSDVNAWCMPGGKVVFYSGIMPICKDEAGIAVVMGHEIAHAIAKHGNERMSQGLLTQLGGVALNVALSDKPEETQNLFMAAYGIGSQVGVMLPYSRMHENEADEIGLVFMALAGYDPNRAVSFWKDMNSLSEGNRPPEFLSTHPSPDTRIANLELLVPKAMKYYKK